MALCDPKLVFEMPPPDVTSVLVFLHGTAGDELPPIAYDILVSHENSAVIICADVPDVSRQKIAVRSRHRLSERTFLQATTRLFKLLKNAFDVILRRQTNNLPVRPADQVRK